MFAWKYAYLLKGWRGQLDRINKINKVPLSAILLILQSCLTQVRFRVGRSRITRLTRL